MGRLAEKLGDRAAGDQGLSGAARPRSHRRRRRAPARGARRPRPATAPRSTLAYERVVALDPFDAQAHTGLGPARAEAQATRRSRSREFRVALAIGPADKAAAHCDLGRGLPARRASRPTPSARRWPRSRSRRASSGRRTCCSSRSRADGAAECGDDRTPGALLPAAAAGGLLLWARCAAPGAGAGGAERRAARSRASPACSGRSRASATTRGRCRRAARYDIYDEPWTIDCPGRRAEPVAPRPDGHVDPGQRAGRPHARGSRASGTIPGSTSSSPATCG